MRDARGDKKSVIRTGVEASQAVEEAFENP